MPKKVAPSKITSGGGFAFEDKVGAYYLAHLLSGEAPFEPEWGLIKRIDFQIRVDGWLLDDMLITTEFNGIEKRTAFSIKSNQQFTSTGAPKDLVHTLWEQLFMKDNNPFNKELDNLGIITSELSTKLKNSLNELLLKVKSQSGESFKNRLNEKNYLNGAIIKLYESFQCPKELQSFNSQNIDQHLVLNKLKALQFDFENPISRDQRYALRICKECLAEDQNTESLKLWDSLLAIVSELRRNSGYIDYKVLIDKLRIKYKLLNVPSYRKDFEKLKNLSIQNLSYISAKLAFKKHISLPKETSNLVNSIENSKISFLIGESGSGKSALIKEFLEEKIKNDPVIYFEAQSFETNDFQSFENSLSLDNSLLTVLNNTTATKAYLVIDSIERITLKHTFNNLSTLINGLNLFSDDNPWRLVFICKSEEFSRIQSALMNSNIKLEGFKEVEHNGFNNKTLLALSNEYESIRYLYAQPHLQKLLQKPKILDLVLRNISSVETLKKDKVISESTLIDWIWEIEVSNKKSGELRKSFLFKLAELQAAELKHEIAIDQFDTSDLIPLDELKSDGICRVHDDRITFTHDLFGDWARLKILRSHKDNLKSYINSRLDSPLWNSAFKYYSLGVLDTVSSVENWEKLFDSFSDNVTAQNLILESILFAPNCYELLVSLKEKLFQNDGDLFKRIITRFLHVMTYPDPMLLFFSKSSSEFSDIEAATFNRIPILLYWIPVLRFIITFNADVLNFSKKHILIIGDIWLRKTLPGTILRKELAKITIEAAEDLIAFTMSKGINIADNSTQALRYRAGIAAYNEFAERVSNLILIAAGKKKPSDEIQSKILMLNKEYDEWTKKHKKERKKRDLSSYPPSLAELGTEMTKPWKIGPKFHQNSVFQEICLDSDALYPIINENPDLAIEIILLMLIQPPHRVNRFDRFSISEDGYSLEKNYTWYPPLFTRGPFMYFLNINFEKGLELILKLVNFATQRWKEIKKVYGIKPLFLSFKFKGNIVSKLYGDNQVFYWHRQISNVPFSVISALMALEIWFYNNLEKGNYDLVDSGIKKIIDETNSLALAGVLCTVAKKHIKYFESSLSPFIIEPILQYWDFIHIFKDEYHQMIGWSHKNSLLSKIASKWHSYNHRKITLEDIFFHIFLNSSAEKQFPKEIVYKSKRYLKKGKISNDFKEYLESLISKSNVNNWEEKKDNKGNQYWEYIPPEDIKEKIKAKEIEANAKKLIVSLPLQCRAILNKDRVLKDEETEDFYNLIHKLPQIAQESKFEEDDIISIQDCICGIIAVIITTQRDWLRRHSHKEKFCLDYIINIITNPPSKSNISSEVDLYDMHWFTFCAVCLPILWSENPKSSKIKEAIARLASIPHYLTVRILFSQCSDFISKLDVHFLQLIVFIIKVAVLRRVHFLLRNDANFNYNDKLQQIIATFPKVDVNSELNNFSALFEMQDIIKETDLPNSFKQGKTDFDRMLIESALSWFPNHYAQIENILNKQFQMFWEKFLDYFIRDIVEELTQNERDNYPPGEWERWLLDGFATLMLFSKNNKMVPEIYRSILNTSDKGHYIINDFLNSFLLSSLNYKQTPDNFINYWADMLSYVFSSNIWIYGKGTTYYLEELWISIIGFSTYINGLWSDKFQKIVSNNVTNYIKWFEINLDHPRCIVRLLIFLQSPAAKLILPDLLEKIVNSTDSLEKHSDDEYKWEAELAVLLSHIWTNYLEDLMTDKHYLVAYKKLLKTLVEKQNSIALALQEKIAGKF